MPDIPLYSGTHSQLGRGATPLPIQDIGIQAAQQANQRGAAALDDTANQYFQIQDFGESQKIERQLRENNNDFDLEFDRRASLAPGSSDSLYDSSGTLRKSALDDLIAQYSDKIESLHGTFINPDPRMRSDAMRLQAIDSLKARAYGKAAQLGIQRSRENFQTNYQLALRNEDFSGAGFAITDARDNGIITAEKADLMLLDLRDTTLLARAQKQSIEDPVSLWNDVESPNSPYALLPPSKLQQVQRLASLSMQGFSKPSIKSSSSSKTSSSAKKLTPDKIKEIYNPAPSNITYNLHKLWRQYNGDFKEGQGKIDAMPYLAEQGRAMITSPHDDTEAELVIALYKQFGQSEDYAKAMIKQWQQDLTRPKSIDPKITLSHAARMGYLTKNEDAAILAIEQEKAQKKEDDTWTPADEARLQAAKDRRNAAAQNAQSILLAKLDIWKNDQQYNRGNNKELTDLEIANQLWDTIANYDPSNQDQIQQDTFRQQEAVNITAASDNYIRKQTAARARNLDLQQNITSTNRLNDEERLAADQLIADIIQKEHASIQSTQPVDSLLPVSRNKEIPSQWGDDGQKAILYVPPGWYANGITVGVTTPHRRYAEAQIVTKPDCSTPTMSKALRRQLGTMHINYDQIIVTATGTKANTSRSNPAALILNNEARRDKHGNLTIYKLPSSDGGGTHEIAGINNGNHPEQYAKLEALIKSGKHAQAEQEAQNYILQYTAPVADLLQEAGSTSPGVDYFLRDIYFNSGQYGTTRVIHRALGIEESKQFNSDTRDAIKNYLKSHTEQQLLDRLKAARERLYKSIADHNPEKLKFLTGWLNRNNRSYQQASSMA